MPVDFREERGWTVIRPRGRALDTTTANEFKQRVADLVRQGHNHLVVDLAQLDFVDSAGLGAIVSCRRAVEECGGGRVVLTSANEQVRGLLAITGLDQIFTLESSIEDTLREQIPS